MPGPKLEKKTRRGSKPASVAGIKQSIREDRGKAPKHSGKRVHSRKKLERGGPFIQKRIKGGGIRRTRVASPVLRFKTRPVEYIRQKGVQESAAKIKRAKKIKLGFYSGKLHRRLKIIQAETSNAGCNKYV